MFSSLWINIWFRRSRAVTESQRDVHGSLGSQTRLPNAKTNRGAVSQRVLWQRHDRSLESGVCCTHLMREIDGVNGTGEEETRGGGGGGGRGRMAVWNPIWDWQHLKDGTALWSDPKQYNHKLSRPQLLPTDWKGILMDEHQSWSE